VAQPAVLDRPTTPHGEAPAAHRFTLAALGLAVGAAVLAGWLPLGCSVVAVFLFAGPHNWLEARYFLSRLPGRWGKLRGYFLLAAAGAVGLTASFAALPGLARAGGWGDRGLSLAAAAWDTGLILWVALLAHLRSRQNPRRDWGWVWPLALALVAVAWAAPHAWGVFLIAVHPLVALWILDREIRRSRPDLRRAYHRCLMVLPLLLGLLCWRLAGTPPLPGGDGLTAQIARQAGADLLPGVSSRLLVAVHAFLEMLHYGVWVLAVPLVGLRAAPWRVRSVPLVGRGSGWRLAVVGFLAVGGVLVVLLWGCFLADYPATWDVYFTVALLHVLAEFPFLLRAL
jgi:hypothetical protein